MVHPCMPSKDGELGTVLHACGNKRSERTLCDLPVTTAEIDVTAGALDMCRQCYPKEKGSGK